MRPSSLLPAGPTPPPAVCGLVLRQSGRHHDSASQTHRFLLSPLSPIVSFCIWFRDSFKDTSMPQYSHRSQPGLNCRPLTVIANICLTRCSPAFVNTLSSFKSQYAPSPLLSNPACQPHAWSDFRITDTHRIGLTCTETQR